MLNSADSLQLQNVTFYICKADSVRFYVPSGLPQFSKDLDQIWHVASLIITCGWSFMRRFLQRNHLTPKHRGQFLNA